MHPECCEERAVRLFTEQLGILGNALLLIGSLVVLAKASDLTINNAIKVSDMTGFGKTTIGFILVGFSTSLPELFVSVFAALGQGSIGIAVGNVLGSNIANIALILGACFLIVAGTSHKYAGFDAGIVKEEIGSLYFGLFMASIIPLALLYFGYASRFMGIILLIIFIVYMVELSRVRTAKNEAAIGPEKTRMPRYISLAFLGSVGVVVTSYFLVDSASFIAGAIGVPAVVIGSTIVAFGTSIPELATSITSVRKRHLNLAFGNIVGSCFINITCILGVTLVASPLTVNITAFSRLAIFSLIANLFLWYFLSLERLTWREGAMFLVIYAVFIATSFTA
jgi:cation:H+ antiporter